MIDEEHDNQSTPSRTPNPNPHASPRRGDQDEVQGPPPWYGVRVELGPRVSRGIWSSFWLIGTLLGLALTLYIGPIVTEQLSRGNRVIDAEEKQRLAENGRNEAVARLAEELKSKTSADAIRTVIETIPDWGSLYRQDLFGERAIAGLEAAAVGKCFGIDWSTSSTPARGPCSILRYMTAETTRRPNIMFFDARAAGAGADGKAIKESKELYAMFHTGCIASYQIGHFLMSVLVENRDTGTILILVADDPEETFAFAILEQACPTDVPSSR